MADLLSVSGARGPGLTELARRTGNYGVQPTDGDFDALVKFGENLLETNPGFQSTIPGPAGPTFTTLTTFRSAPSSNKKQALKVPGIAPGDFYFETTNPPYVDDGASVIKANDTPLSVGAWVRQSTDSIGHTASLVPAPTRAVNRVLDDMPTLPSLGVTADASDNSGKLAEIMAKARDLAVGTATPPRIRVPAGVYRYATSPNFAVQGMTLDCEPGAILHHTGGGVAFNVDGGADGGGIGMMKVTGGLVVRGNPTTTTGVYNRAVHHSTFDVEVQNVSGAALRTEWVVCNEYWFRYNSLFRPGFSPIATIGAFLTRRNAGERTSACTFHNPIIGGVNGYGMIFDDAIANKTILGTVEACVGGVFLGDNAISNEIDGLDVEFNTSIDFFCRGVYNVIRSRFSDHTSTIAGLFNRWAGGMCNELINTGDHNIFDAVNYGISGGAFVDSGTATSYTSMRNATAGAFIPDRLDRVLGRMQVGNVGAGVLFGRADMVDGGSASDVVLAQQGPGVAYLRSPVGSRMGWNNAGLGFFDKAMAPIAKPNVAGSRGSNIALAALLDALAAYGLIVNSTT